ncbi:MAG TPA: hypothetical protein VHK27_11375 [Gammaproteobacteria bacterium]|nr:hypothetical protein [Gammaproteobacteria bacterium]
MASILIASAAVAAGPKDYQVTGPVLDVNDDMIVVEKGKEKWEIGRGKDTKVKGDLKKGSTVTVHYKMTATSIESKDAPDTKTKVDSKTDPKTKTDTKTTK